MQEIKSFDRISYMEIFWRGQSFFELKIKGDNKEIVSLAIDPFDESLGLKIPKIEAHVLLITHNHSDHNNIKAVQGDPFLIDAPGEYEVKKVFIKGIPSFHDNDEGRKMGANIIYKIEAEGMKICHLGDMGQKELTDEQVEEIGEIDVLMISIANPNDFINAKQAAEIISQIEPKVVIPMHYKLPNMKVQFDGADKFLKIMGAEGIQPQKKFKVSPKDSSKEETEIVILEP